MKHQIKIFSAKSESRLTELVNDWLEENNIYKIIDIKFSMTSNLMSNGREIHTYCALIHYYNRSLDGKTAKAFYEAMYGNIESRGDK